MRLKLNTQPIEAIVTELSLKPGTLFRPANADVTSVWLRLSESNAICLGSATHRTTGILIKALGVPCTVLPPGTEVTFVQE